MYSEYISKERYGNRTSETMYGNSDDTIDTTIKKVTKISKTAYSVGTKNPSIANKNPGTIPSTTLILMLLSLLLLRFIEKKSKFKSS